MFGLLLSLQAPGNLSHLVVIISVTQGQPTNEERVRKRRRGGEAAVLDRKCCKQQKSEVKGGNKSRADLSVPVTRLVYIRN